MTSDLAALGIEAKHLLIFAGIVGVVLIIVISKLAEVSKARVREQTRREIAAYVAEGSMDADQADRLLGLEQSEAEKKITEAVSWGMLSSNKAESLIRTLREQRGSNPSPSHGRTA